MFETKKIEIYSDTGQGDKFDIIQILFENESVIVGEAYNQWYSETLTVMIDKETNKVFGNNLHFYYAKYK